MNEGVREGASLDAFPVRGDESPASGFGVRNAGDRGRAAPERVPGEALPRAREHRSPGQQRTPGGERQSERSEDRAGMHDDEQRGDGGRGAQCDPQGG